MKKQLLVGAFMLASFLTAQAQETLYSQDFEDIDAVFPEEGPSWGNYDLDGDDAGFFIFNEQAAITALGFSGQVAGSANFVTDETGNITAESPDTDNILESLAFELPADGNYTVSFKGATAPIEEGAVAPYSVYVIGDDEAAALAEVTSAEEFIAALDGFTPITSGEGAEEATEIEMDLTAYAGQTVSIMVRHHNTDLLAYFMMDDFTLTSGVMAVDKHLANAISIYPNPTNDIVNVANAENILVNGITVTDINGRTVKTTKFDGVANAQINISDLASGVYMMTVSSDKGSMTKKIVKN